MGVALNPSLREITFTIASGDADLTPEAVEVAIAMVRKTEERYAINPASVTDIVDEPVVLTGKTPFRVYIFEVALTKATGTYSFILEEVAANVESSVYLNPAPEA